MNLLSKKEALFAAALSMAACHAQSPVPRADGTEPAAQTAAPDHPVGDGCEDCELMFEGMPPIDSIGPAARLAAPDEPGERLELAGRALQKDGTTPAPGVVIYAYNTAATGRYTPSPGQKLGRRHGRLRGWARTDGEGRFRIETVRPGAYPGEDIPQHIHFLVKEPGRTVYWIDDALFDDDPLLTQKERDRANGRGGKRIVALKKTPGGWAGEIVIVLGRNIPNYR